MAAACRAHMRQHRLRAAHHPKIIDIGDPAQFGVRHLFQRAQQAGTGIVDQYVDFAFARHHLRHALADAVRHFHIQRSQRDVELVLRDLFLQCMRLRWLAHAGPHLVPACRQFQRQRCAQAMRGPGNQDRFCHRITPFRETDWGRRPLYACRAAKPASCCRSAFRRFCETHFAPCCCRARAFPVPPVCGPAGTPLAIRLACQSRFE